MNLQFYLSKCNYTIGNVRNSIKIIKITEEHTIKQVSIVLTQTRTLSISPYSSGCDFKQFAQGVGKVRNAESNLRN